MTANTSEAIVEVLVVTVGAPDTTLLAQMNVKGRAVLANQSDCDRVDYVHNFDGVPVVHVRSTGRGVGRNRNIALAHASSPLCLLADDDMVFFDDYQTVARSWFERLPAADVLIFNLADAGPRRRQVTTPTRVRSWNYFNFGAARIGFRRCSIQHAQIEFSHSFGGGAEFAAGEDTLFLKDCLRKGLKVWAVPATLANLTEVRSSSWFRGYNAKYFGDKGALYVAAAPRLWPFLVAVFAIRRRSLFQHETRPSDAFMFMWRGARAFQRLQAG